MSKRIPRRALFELIDLDIITGYNNYKDPTKTLIPEPPFDYMVAYYHKELGVLSNYRKKIFYDIPLITISTSQDLTKNIPREEYGIMSRMWLNSPLETSTFVGKAEEKDNILKRALEIIDALGGEEDIFANTKFVNFATQIRAKNVFNKFKTRVLKAKTDFDYEVIKQLLLPS